MAGIDGRGDGDDDPSMTTPSQRSRSRDSLFLTATMRIGEAMEVQEVRVRNLSEGGLMAEIGRIVPEGTAVRLELRGIGEVGGRVAWCTGGRLGIALDSPIDPLKARKPVGGRGVAAAKR